MCIKTELSRGKAALGTEQRRPAQLGALSGPGVGNISQKGWGMHESTSPTFIESSPCGTPQNKDDVPGNISKTRDSSQS